MGRRELLIALAFVSAGILVYQLTAPARAPASGAPFDDLMAEFRREIRGNPGRAAFTHRGTIPVPREITELRLPAAVGVTVVGESRADVAYELTVQSVGPDDAAALAAARDAAVSSDTIGHVLALAHERRGRSTAALIVRAPSRLAVRLEGVRRASVAEVTAVHVEGLVGDAELRNVAGAVTGTHRNGTLGVDGAGSVELTLTGSRAALAGVRGSVRLAGRGGEAQILDAGGDVDVHATDVDVTVVRPRGRVRLAGSNGRVVVDRPAGATEIDGRRLEVTIIVQTATPVIAMTSERPLQLLLDGTPAVTIDAATSDGGAIDATAFDLTPERVAAGEQLRHRFGEAARIALRNSRGAIVIGRSK